MYFFTPAQSGVSVWSEHHVVSTEFFGSDNTPLLPHSSLGLILDELQEDFCGLCNFLSTAQLLNHFSSLSHSKDAEDVVCCLNLFQARLGFKDGDGACHTKKWRTFWECPLVWDTGASFGLTPLGGNLIIWSAIYQSMTLSGQIW